MSNTACLYHANCADGFTAAWAVWRAFRERNLPAAFHPVQHGDPPPDVAGQHVLLVDFSYPRQTLLDMAATAASVLVLDHHASAQEDLRGLSMLRGGGASPRAGYHADVYFDARHNAAHALWAHFDMERSGAGITWDFFNPGRQRPLMVQVVEDYDLWRFRYPNTKLLMAALFSYRYDFIVWEILAARLEADGYGGLLSEGTAVARKHDRDLEELLAAATLDMVVGGHIVKGINLPHQYANDAAGALSDGRPFGVCFFRRDGVWQFSLRSRQPDGIDVSQVAAVYGGGGHKHAAGFVGDSRTLLKFLREA